MSAPTTTSEQPPVASVDVRDAQPRALPPLWSVELLDVLGRRGGFALAVAAVLSALALIVAVALPAVIPPRPLVGLLVATTALAVGLSLALALDALDVRVRGPRHVRSSGGELVALLPEAAAPRDARDLADAVRAVHVPGATLHLGLAPVGEDLTSSAAWTRALGEALADSGSSVLLVDLASGGSDGAGILEVVRDRRPLSEVVTYVEGRPLAEVGPGADVLQALQALITLPTLLPEDVDVMLVALPQIVTRTAVNASRVLDQVLFVAEANLTSRVELMASLDALRVAGCGPQVVLVDGGTYTALRPDPVPAPQAPDRPAARIDPVPLEGAAAAAAIAAAAAASAASSAAAASTAVTASTAAAEEPAAASAEPVAEEAEPLAEEPESVLEAAPAPEPVASEPESVPPAPVATQHADEDVASSPLRAVDVLEEAARERAEATIEATLADTVPMDRSEVLAHRVPTPPAPDPAPAPERAQVPVPTPAPVPAPAPASPRVPVVADTDDERTTELSVDTGQLPDWASVEEEEDLLRTTVQMSVFNEELDLRDED